MVLVVTIRHRANGPLFPPKARQIALSTNDITNFWSLLRDSNIKPDQCKSLVWESHVRQQIFVVFEDVYR